jgi:hypothetical protein
MVSVSKFWHIKIDYRAIKDLADKLSSFVLQVAKKDGSLGPIPSNKVLFYFQISKFLFLLSVFLVCKILNSFFCFLFMLFANKV